ncbi:hypothetical protein GCM10027082_26770 [Comamonas humi]
MAFIGLPWPTNSTGMRGDGFSDCSSGAAASAGGKEFREKPARPARAAKVVLRCMGNGYGGWDVLG